MCVCGGGGGLPLIIWILIACILGLQDTVREKEFLCARADYSFPEQPNHPDYLVYRCYLSIQANEFPDQS